MQANQIDQWLSEAATTAEKVRKVDIRNEAEKLKTEEEASVNAEKVKDERVQADEDAKIAVEEELKAKSVGEEAKTFKVEGEASMGAEEESKMTAEGVKVMITATDGAKSLKKEEKSKVKVKEEAAVCVQSEGEINATTEVKAKNAATATEEDELVRVQDSSSLSSSLSSSKDNSSKLRIQLRLFSKNLTQYKDKIKEAAISIEKQSAAELKGIQMRRKQQEAKRLKIELEKDLASKRNEQIVHLEKLKVDVTDIRSEKTRKLKRLLRRQKKNPVKSKIDKSPTSIIMSSNYFDDKETRSYNGDLLSNGVVVECMEQSNPDDQRQESEGAETVEEMKLVARAKVEQELEMAKEVKRNMMAELAKERDADKLSQGCDDGKELNETTPKRKNTEEFVGDVPTSTLCRLLSCAEEELYDSNSSSDSDVQYTITSLVRDIEGYDARLSDIEVMQSILLAENAAAEGVDEFKIGADGIRLDGIKNEYNSSLVDCPSLMDPMEGAILLAESAAAQGEDGFKIGADGFSPVDPMESAILLAERAAAQGVDDFKIGGSSTKKSLRTEFVSSCEDISSRARKSMLTLRQRLDRPALWKKRRQITNE